MIKIPLIYNLFCQENLLKRNKIFDEYLLNRFMVFLNKKSERKKSTEVN